MSNEVENTGKILIYQNEKGDTRIDVYFESDTIWMTQKAMCELYQVAKSSVSEHISNIFKDGELEPEATVRKFRTVQIEGTRQVTRERDYYNLDMILAVGYRVRSNVGIHFRRWASGVLTEYMKKGFALNDERLRNPREFGGSAVACPLERRTPLPHHRQGPRILSARGCGHAPGRGCPISRRGHRREDAGVYGRYGNRPAA